MKTRLIAAVVLMLAFGVAYQSGLFEFVREPEQLQALLAELGVWAPLGFVLGFSLLQPFGAPGILFIVVASVIWPLWLAFLLVWLSTQGASLVGFGFARTIGRDWAQAHLPERFRRYDLQLAENGVRAVFMLRLLTFLTPPVHWALGLSQVRVSSFLIGTALGYLPWCLLLTFTGRKAFAWLVIQPAKVWIALAVGIAFAVAVRRWQVRRRRSDKIPAELAAEEIRWTRQR